MLQWIDTIVTPTPNLPSLGTSAGVYTPHPGSGLAVY